MSPLRAQRPEVWLVRRHSYNLVTALAVTQADSPIPQEYNSIFCLVTTLIYCQWQNPGADYFQVLIISIEIAALAFYTGWFVDCDYSAVESRAVS